MVDGKLVSYVSTKFKAPATDDQRSIFLKIRFAIALFIFALLRFKLGNILNKKYLSSMFVFSVTMTWSAGISLTGI